MKKVLRNGLEVFLAYLAPGRLLLRNNNHSAAAFVTAVITILDVVVVYFVWFDVPDNRAEVQAKLTTAIVYMLLRALVAISLKFLPKYSFAYIPDIGRRNAHSLSIFLATYPFLILGFIASVHVFKLSAWGFYQGPSTLSIPTLYPNEVIVIEHNYFKKNAAFRGDLVVYQRVDNFFISRVAAIPGDIIGIKNGAILLNGQVRRLQSMNMCISVADRSYQAIEEEIEINTGRYIALIGNCGAEISYSMKSTEVFANEIVLIYDNRSESGTLFSSLPSVPIATDVFKVPASALLHRPKFIYWSPLDGRADIVLNK